MINKKLKKRDIITVINEQRNLRETVNLLDEYGYDDERVKSHTENDVIDTLIDVLGSIDVNSKKLHDTLLLVGSEDSTTGKSLWEQYYKFMSSTDSFVKHLMQKQEKEE